ncbi:hypothetical protein ABPG72_006709 [Tetrahymena utriculariae]
MSQYISIYPFINSDDYDNFQQYPSDFIENSEQMSGIVSQNIIYEPEYFLNTEYLSKEDSNFDKQNALETYQPQLLNQIYEYQIQNNINVNKCQYQQQIQEMQNYSRDSSNQNGCFLKFRETFYQQDENKLTFENEQQEQQSQLQKSDQETQENNNNNINQKLNKNKFKYQNQTTVSAQKNKPLDEEKSKKQSHQNQFKNIVNAFKGYVKKLKKCEFVEVSDYEFSNLKKQLMRYMKLNSFNYSLLKYIINHKFYKLMLLNFFQKESEFWIDSSKLRDKQDVFQKIQQLTECIKYPQLLETLLGQQKNKIKKQEA